MVISIPKNYAGQLQITSDYGDCEIMDLEEASLKIEANCGDIQLGKIKNLDAKCEYGDIRIAEIFNRCVIESSCGDIKIEQVALQENSVIKSNYGDVKIAKINDIYVDAKVNLGDTKIVENNRHAEIILSIEADMRRRESRQIKEKIRICKKILIFFGKRLDRIYT